MSKRARWVRNKALGRHVSYTGHFHDRFVERLQLQEPNEPPNWAYSRARSLIKDFLTFALPVKMIVDEGKVRLCHKEDVEMWLGMGKWVAPMRKLGSGKRANLRAITIYEVEDVTYFRKNVGPSSSSSSSTSSPS